MKFSQKTILVSLLLLFAVSCGGGGGGGGDSQTGSITVSADGTYFIRVNASSGYSNYVLSIGQGASSAGTKAVRNAPSVLVPNVTYTAGGTVSASTSSAVDSDVNDPNAPYESNDSFGSAQSIANPVTLGGYVNVAGTGETGRSLVDGDPDDYFTVALVKDQVINLFIGDSDAGSLGLYLYDDSFNAVFVPGEIIVRFKDNSISSEGIIAEDTVFATGLIRKAGSPGRVELMSLGSEENRQRVLYRLGITDRIKSMAGTLLVEGGVGLKRDTIRVIEALRKRSDVLYAEPNYIRYASAVPDDTYYSLQWHYPLINLPQAWGATTGISSVIVAVIDTGVLLSHPDLLGQFVSGYDFISSLSNALDGDGIDNNPDDPGDESAGGSSFHGTHVAGTVAAATNNSKGIAGIAWGVKIMPIRVLGKLGGTSYDLIQSIKFAAGIANDSGTVPTQAADIINLSLGGGSYSQAEQDVITQARNAGVIIVASAGNNNNSSPFYPAAYNGVVSVSAVDMEKNRSYYSNYGSTIDIAAPGGDLRVDTDGDGYNDGVLSTLGDDSSGSIEFIYAFYQGTSMAAPHISGVVALMKSVNLTLTPAEFDSLLSSGSITEDIGTTGRDDQFGYGLIDAFKAVNEAQSVTPVTPLLIITPISLNFGSSETALTLSAINGGGGTLTLSLPTDDAAWLTVAASNVDADNLGTYTASVSRNGLADGTYTVTITFTSSTNTVTVPVIMQVSTGASTADVGYHYVLLLDPQTYDTIYQFSVGVDSGSYSYLFPSVDSGEYIVMAGSDLNNNNVICEPGEACGAYTILNDPTTVNITGNLSGLDFFSSFDVSFEDMSLSSNSRIRKISQRKVIRRIR